MPYTPRTWASRASLAPNASVMPQFEPQGGFRKVGAVDIAKQHGRSENSQWAWGLMTGNERS